MDLEGKTALVTGGTKGIGRAIAEVLHQAGMNVLVTGRTTQSEQSALEFPTFIGDHSLDYEGEKLRRWMVGQDGKLDVLVNNAGVQLKYDFVDASVAVELFEQEIAINLMAPVWVTKAMMPMLCESGGAAIVNITSALALTPKQSAPSYCASKAAFRSFTKSLRFQLEGRGIKVFEVLPPSVKTAMTRKSDVEMLSASDVATLLLGALQEDEYEIYPGSADLLRSLLLADPTQAEKIVRPM